MLYTILKFHANINIREYNTKRQSQFWLAQYVSNGQIGSIDSLFGNVNY